MRLILLLALLPLQAQAWTFTPGLICRLTHETPQARIELTYDPAAPLYSITVTTQNPLPRSQVVSMTFVGPSGRTISTDRHTYSPDGRSGTAQDTGFGNVLDGLQFNQTAQAIIGGTTLTFALEGAAEPTAKFRACEVSAGA